MAKIPKNRQDTEMIGNVLEQTSFEHVSDGVADQPVAKPVKAEPAKTAYAAFLTPELQEDLGKALLTLKLKLYKEGIIDYTLKVSCETDQVVLKAVPLKKSPKQR
ncbi:MAG: hypothetical protein P4N59_12660 [Negativicutes bacterium]|nr:hypothetical protein [Negativicutes bacterium]